MVLSLFALGQESASFRLIAVATILRDLALVSLIAFFLWRNNAPASLLGWSLPEHYKRNCRGARAISSRIDGRQYCGENVANCPFLGASKLTERLSIVRTSAGWLIPLETFPRSANCGALFAGFHQYHPDTSTRAQTLVLRFSVQHRHEPPGFRSCLVDGRAPIVRKSKQRRVSANAGRMIQHGQRLLIHLNQVVGGRNWSVVFETPRFRSKQT